ncbi:MAG TPA: hypothetical protein VFA06_16055, partial [Actinocrinis sp.]
MLMVVGLRPDDPGAQAPLIDAIAGDPSTVSIRPRPLSDTGVAALVRQRLGEDADAGFCVACHRATGGNPLLTTELLKALAAESVRPEERQVAMIEKLGPRSMSRTVLLRLTRLPPHATSVAEALAVLGDEAELSVIAALAGLEEDRAVDALTALARAELVRAQAPWGFVHPVVAATIYNDVLLTERQARHRLAAELLHAAGAPVQRVAGQLLLAPARDERWAVQALTSA